MLRWLSRCLASRNHHHAIDYLAIMNSGISAIALLPQLYTLLTETSASGLSPISFFLIALNSVIWLAYGFHRKTPPLIISSLCNSTISIIILLLILM